MITLYNAASNTYHNHYGPDDEWLVGEASGQFHLLAREQGTTEWVLVNRRTSVSAIEKAKRWRMADYASMKGE